MKQILLIITLAFCFIACEETTYELKNHKNCTIYGHIHFHDMYPELYGVKEELSFFINDEPIDLDENYGYSHVLEIGKTYGVRAESQLFGSVQRDYTPEYSGEIYGIDLKMHRNPELHVSKLTFDPVEMMVTAETDNLEEDVYVYCYHTDGEKMLRQCYFKLINSEGQLSAKVSKRNETQFFPNLESSTEGFYYSTNTWLDIGIHRDYLSAQNDDYVVLASGAKKFEAGLEVVPFDEVHVIDTMTNKSSEYLVLGNCRWWMMSPENHLVIMDKMSFVELNLPTANDSLYLSFDVDFAPAMMQTDTVPNIIFNLNDNYHQVVEEGGIGHYRISLAEYSKYNETTFVLRNISKDNNYYAISNIHLEYIGRQYKD